MPGTIFKLLTWVFQSSALVADLSLTITVHHPYFWYKPLLIIQICSASMPYYMNKFNNTIVIATGKTTKVISWGSSYAKDLSHDKRHWPPKRNLLKKQKKILWCMTILHTIKFLVYIFLHIISRLLIQLYWYCNFYFYLTFVYLAFGIYKLNRLQLHFYTPVSSLVWGDYLGYS